jgi:hypothetical protein
MINHSYRPIHIIAAEIDKDWSNNSKNGIYFGAKPYLNAMYSLNKVTDKYGEDSAEFILLYFLANASTWRGTTAKRIKAELKDILK